MEEQLRREGKEMNKKQWREKALAFLKSLPTEEKRNIEDAFHNQLFSHPLWKESKMIGTTLSSALEWDTRRIIEQAWKEGKEVVVPKTLPKTKQMKFYLIFSFNQIAPGHFGMDEPLLEKAMVVDKDEIDLLLVPGLIFHPKGYRIGFGGGYYDRFLMDFMNTTVSFAHSEQIDSAIPTESHDIPMDYLLTEEKWIQT